MENNIFLIFQSIINFWNNPDLNRTNYMKINSGLFRPNARYSSKIGKDLNTKLSFHLFCMIIDLLNQRSTESLSFPNEHFQLSLTMVDKVHKISSGNQSSDIVLWLFDLLTSRLHHKFFSAKDLIYRLNDVVLGNESFPNFQFFKYFMYCDFDLQ